MEYYLSHYKIPIAFSILTILFIIAGLVALYRSDSSNNPQIRVLSDSDEASSSGSLLTVAIEGAITKPGIYSLPPESRVNDLFEIAGGPAVDADLEWIARTINKAQVLSDGAKLYLPRVGEIDSSNSGSVNGGLGGLSGIVNVNTASQASLEELPGIGPKTAEKIIQGRPYAQLEQLLERKIVGQATFEKIRAQISVL